MMKFDGVIKDETKEHNLYWPQIPAHPWRIIIIGGSRSGKINSLFEGY